MTNKDRIKIFKDTLKIKYTKESFVYEENDTRLNTIKLKPPKIIWSDNSVKTILNIPHKYHVAVLNFADPFIPGGMVWEGIDTQEECLCRCSTLYHSLKISNNLFNFYIYNRRKGCSTDRIIYSKDVLFFKNDNYKYIPSARYCDVITCAAPKAEEFFTNEDIKKRMKNIINSAIDNKVDVLILGRWGCGAFGNDWNLFKQLWASTIAEYEENNFDFAIKYDEIIGEQL